MPPDVHASSIGKSHRAKQLCALHPHLEFKVEVDEVDANKNLNFMGPLTEFPHIYQNIIDPVKLSKMDINAVTGDIIKAHQQAVEQHV